MGSGGQQDPAMACNRAMIGLSPALSVSLVPLQWRQQAHPLRAAPRGRRLAMLRACAPPTVLQGTRHDICIVTSQQVPCRSPNFARPSVDAIFADSHHEYLTNEGRAHDKLCALLCLFFLAGKLNLQQIKKKTMIEKIKPAFHGRIAP